MKQKKKKKKKNKFTINYREIHKKHINSNGSVTKSNIKYETKFRTE